MGKDTKVKSAGADHGAKAAPAAPDTSHDFMARALLDDHTEPECIAQVLYDNQRYSNDIMAYVARTFGNDVLNQVIGAYAALQTAKPFGDDHAGASADRAALVGTAQTGTFKGTPDPADRLPFDGRGGWNAVEINQCLGQYDAIAATDSDGARCAFATALAAQVFSGPLKLIRWLEDYTSQWQPKDELGNILDLSARQSSAANVMLAVIAAIRAGTATYGDLSWLQEALHAFRIAGEQRGPKSSGAMIAGKHEDVVAMTVAECGSPKAVIEAVGALEPGDKILLEWTAAEVGKAEFQHQLMVIDHGGTTYLYDSEHQRDGTHLDPLSEKALKPYFGKKYEQSSIKLAVKTRPRAPAAK